MSSRYGFETEDDRKREQEELTAEWRRVRPTLRDILDDLGHVWVDGKSLYEGSGNVYRIQETDRTIALVYCIQFKYDRLLLHHGIVLRTVTNSSVGKIARSRFVITVDVRKWDTWDTSDNRPFSQMRDIPDEHHTDETTLCRVIGEHTGLSVVMPEWGVGARGGAYATGRWYFMRP